MEEVQRRLICKTHKRKASHLRLNISKDDPCYLLCDVCVMKKQEDCEMISLKLLKESGDHSIIENWPRGLESQYFEFLMDQSQEVDYQKQLLKQLNEFQENLIYDITKIIKDTFVKQFEILKEMIQENRLVSAYNSLFSKQQLIEIVNNFDEQKYELFLNDFEKVREQNIATILTQIKKFQNYSQLLQFDSLISTKERVLNILSKMKFFESSIEDNNQINDNNNLDLLVDPHLQCMEHFYKEKKTIDILESIQLIKTNFEDGEKRIQITKDDKNQIEVGVDQSLSLNFSGSKNRYLNCVSNQILEKNKKYVFRIEISGTDGHPCFGIMSKSLENIVHGYEQFLCCDLRFKNGELHQGLFYGIEQNVKGDQFKLSKERVAEMRVWLQGKQLEVLDYPNYHYKIAVKEEYKDILHAINDFKLYFCMSLLNKNLKYKLLEAYIVDSFDQE